MNYPYLCPVIINQKKEEQTMARPIKETPILFGKEARRFEERMKHPRKLSKERLAEMQRNYEALKSVFIENDNSRES